MYGLPRIVSPKVLIPRDDTCAVAELAIKQALFLDKDPRILDLCCGSGCIGLAVASRVKDAKVTLADFRYVQPELLGQLLDFHGQDALFLYSTLVLNSSAALK